MIKNCSYGVTVIVFRRTLIRQIHTRRNTGECHGERSLRYVNSSIYLFDTFKLFISGRTPTSVPTGWKPPFTVHRFWIPWRSLQPGGGEYTVDEWMNYRLILLCRWSFDLLILLDAFSRHSPIWPDSTLVRCYRIISWRSSVWLSALVWGSRELFTRAKKVIILTPTDHVYRTSSISRFACRALFRPSQLAFRMDSRSCSFRAKEGR